MCGKAEEELPKLIGNNGSAKEIDQGVPEIEKVDVVILDPPRSGCEESLLECVVQVKPQRVVYVSCDPATLARDLKFLAARGYVPVEATPVDMFPWTGHVETVVLLSKLKTKRYIDVTIDMNEIYLTEA